MPEILSLPSGLCPLVDTTFRLRSFSISAQRATTRTRSAYGPISQVWAAELPYYIRERREWLRFVAAVDGLGGISGYVRMSDPKRPRPWLNMRAPAGTTPWSDDTDWDDGTEWADSLLPAYGGVGEAAQRGDNTVLIEGLPASLSPALVAGDLFEIRPNGQPWEFGHLYQCRKDGPTDANGRTRVEITPRLRADIAAGDQIVLERASSVFQLVDDDQGILNHVGAGIATAGISLIERVP